jgi:hypothetical protein
MNVRGKNSIFKEAILMDNIYDVTKGANDYQVLVAEIERLREENRDMKKKELKCGKNGHRKGKKKLMKKNKRLKRENEQLKYFLATSGTQQKFTWWQDALVRSLPKALDLANVVLKKRLAQQVRVLPARHQSPFYLPEDVIDVEFRAAGLQSGKE